MWRDSQWNVWVGQWTHASKKVRHQTQNEDVNRPENRRTCYIALHRRDNIFDNNIEKENISSKMCVSLHRRLWNWNDCIIVALWVVTSIERADHSAFHTSHQMCILWYALLLRGPRSTTSSTHQRLASLHNYNERSTRCLLVLLLELRIRFK